MPHQQPHIIHEAPHHIDKQTRPALARLAPLLPQHRRLQLDLELMLLVPARLAQRDLRQVDLVRLVPVRQPVLVPAADPLPRHAVRGLGQPVRVPAHHARRRRRQRRLQVHRDAPVEGRARAVHVEVREAHLDQPRELGARLLVDGDADARLRRRAARGGAALRGQQPAHVWR